jgi:succinate-semialdehyde dehydrogenase/glutarate-semialdehyde dehydrogenase
MTPAGSSELRQPRLWAHRAWVDGQWIAGESGEVMDVTNPASRQSLGTVPRLGASETLRAIAAAERALPAWRARPAAERAALLRRWNNLLLEHQDDLARIMTLEQGKPFAEARGEISYAASFLEWYAEEAKRVYGETIPAKGADRRTIVLKEAVGVCAAITPWNFPAAMITRKAGPALAAGCTLVIKPAAQTPFSALALAVLAEEAGIPAGVLNVVTGDARTIGAELTGSPVVRKLSFTGSTAVGRVLMAQCAATVKRLSLELGGNAPFIVFADADLDAAVEGLMQSKFRNTGQTCVCANRVLVHAEVYDRFAEKLLGAVRKLTVGAGFEPGVQQGPLIDAAALAKVEELVADALRLGGRILLGGKRHARGGTFYEPTVIAEASPAMKLAREEIFGPVAPLFRFHSDAEAVAMANATEFGLAAYFFSRDVGRVWRTAEALECGMVGVNTGLISTEAAPFGGVKQSGLGREGARHGLEEYLSVKYVSLSGL